MRATSLNFGITLVGFLIPVLLAFWQGWVSELTAEILAGTGAIVVPVLLYRGTRSWGLMNYYIFFPEELPANGGENPAGRESVDHHVEN